MPLVAGDGGYSKCKVRCLGKDGKAAPMTYDWESKGTFISGNVIAKQKDILSCMEEIPEDVKGYASLSLKALEETNTL